MYVCMYVCFYLFTMYVFIQLCKYYVCMYVFKVKIFCASRSSCVKQNMYNVRIYACTNSMCVCMYVYMIVCMNVLPGLHDGVRGAGCGGSAAAGRSLRRQLHGDRREDAGRRPPFQGMYVCMYVICICVYRYHFHLRKRQFYAQDLKFMYMCVLCMYVYVCFRPSACMYVCVYVCIICVCSSLISSVCIR